MTTPPTILLRPLQAADAQALGDLFSAAVADPVSTRFFHPFPLTRRQAADLCERATTCRDKYFVLAVGDRLAGFGMLRGWDAGYTVPSFGVCVHPRAQGTAAGHALTAYAIREAKRAGSSSMRLTVYRANSRAAHLYQRYGFKYAPKPGHPDEQVGTLNLSAAEGKPLKPLAEEQLLAWHVAEGNRPFRIGIWMEYGGHTLQPVAGIGVFVTNLVQGLLVHPDRPELVLAVSPGDQHMLAGLAKAGDGRVTVLPLAQKVQKRQDLFRRVFGPPSRFVRDVARWARQTVVASVRSRIDANPWLALALTPVLLPLVYLKLALWPVARTARKLARYADQEPEIIHPDLHAEATAAGCDVWVYPYHLVPFSIAHSPAVLFVHDMVNSRFPELFKADDVTHLERVVATRCQEATVVACMSEFIRQNDLLGLLGLPPTKVRMVRPAAPTDFPTAAASRPPGQSRPFLFYPSGLRGYKNHVALIDALAVLRDRDGDERFDLVFTGGYEHDLAEQIRRHADRHGLADRVHILGCVSREELAGLYLTAEATVVPSLYEQGSFPLYEALHYGCPVAAADIPPLREQCEGMGDAMHYFDPLDPTSVADSIRRLTADRDRIRAAQTAASKVLWDRNWPDVADRWLSVFREAANKFAAPPICPATPPTTRPLRIGMWLDYNGTQTPYEGIGVHIHSLLNGFLDLPERVDLTLLGRWGQEQVLDALVKRGGDRVRVIPGPNQRLADPAAAATAAGCDLWILPYIGTCPAPRVPYGVIVHDLVYTAHPEAFDPAWVAEVDTVARQVIDRSVSVVCLTDTLAEAEAIKHLKLPRSKVRVIRPAATALPPDGKPADEKLLAKLTRPFLFYPGAFRPYKNHAALLHALRLLREEHGEFNLDVVFTGAHSHLPPDLAAQPGVAALKGHIHVLGRVSRATIDALYDRATALVFPSRYEGCGLPAYEAVDRGCPIILSDLPVFREQFAAFGDTVPYFNPDRPRELVRVLLDLLPKRDEVKAAQQVHRAGLLARNWQDVAAEWVTLARELAAGPAARPALQLHRPADAA